jgi:hypothetical protein
MAKGKGLIIGISVAAAGVGAYFLGRSFGWWGKGTSKEDEFGYEGGSTTETYVAPASCKFPETPFKNKKDGDAFRAWVNDKHSKYARQIDLDPSGAFNNCYIREAYDKLGRDFEIFANPVTVKRSYVKEGRYHNLPCSEAERRVVAKFIIDNTNVGIGLNKNQYDAKVESLIKKSCGYTFQWVKAIKFKAYGFIYSGVKYKTENGMKS